MSWHDITLQKDTLHTLKPSYWCYSVFTLDTKFGGLLLSFGGGKGKKFQQVIFLRVHVIGKIIWHDPNAAASPISFLQNDFITFSVNYNALETCQRRKQRPCV